MLYELGGRRYGPYLSLDIHSPKKKKPLVINAVCMFPLKTKNNNNSNN